MPQSQVNPSLARRFALAIGLALVAPRAKASLAKQAGPPLKLTVLRDGVEREFHLLVAAESRQPLFCGALSAIIAGPEWQP